MASTPDPCRRDLLRRGQPDDEFAALVGPGAGSRHGPAVHLHQTPNQTQTDSQALRHPAGHAIRLLEQVENVGKHLRSDANAVVPDPEHRRIHLALGRQKDLSAGRRVLGGVRQKVRQHLLQPGGVGFEDNLAERPDLQALPSLVQKRPHVLGNAGDKRSQFQTFLAQLELAPGDPGHVQQVVYEPDHVAQLALHHLAGVAKVLWSSGSCSRSSWRPLLMGARGFRSS